MVGVPDVDVGLRPRVLDAVREAPGWEYVVNGALCAAEAAPCMRESFVCGVIVHGRYQVEWGDVVVKCL